MKAADLIKALQAVDPESEVRFCVGDRRDDDYRDMCAKVELIHGNCLEKLSVALVEIEPKDKPSAHIVLLADGFNGYNFLSYVNEFNQQFPELRKHDPETK